MNTMAPKTAIAAFWLALIAALAASGFELAVYPVQAGQDKGKLNDSSTFAAKKENAPEDSRAAAELVKKLSSDKFQERESAEKALRAMGMKAIPALNTGIKGASPEVVQRCQRLLTGIRKDDIDRFIKALLSDTDFKEVIDHPIWVRWTTIAGDDRNSRELFAEVLAVEGAAAALKSLEDNPKSANKSYCTELFRLHASVEPLTRIGDRHIRSLSSCYSLGEAAYGVYLGSFSGATTVKPERRGGPVDADPEMEVLDAITHLLYKKRGPWSAEAADAGKYQFDNRSLIGPRDKLMVASLANLMNPRAIEHGLRWGDGLRDADLSVCLPLARTVCRNKTLPLNVRACSWPYLSEAGEIEFLPDIAEWKADTTRIQQFWRSDESNREYTVLVSDVSLATQLLMHKQLVKDFGFVEKLNEGKKRVDRSCFAFGFPDNASRKAAHEKALAFLAKAPVPKGPPPK